MRPNAAIACGVALIVLLSGVASASPLELITRTDSGITGTDINSFSLSSSFQSGSFSLSEGETVMRPPEGWGIGPMGGSWGFIAFHEPVDYHFSIELYFVPPGTSTASMVGDAGLPVANPAEISISGEMKGYLGSDGTKDIGLTVNPSNLHFGVSDSAKASLPQSLISAFTDPGRVQVSQYIWSIPRDNQFYSTLTIAPPAPGDPQAVPEPSTCVAFAGLALGLLVRRQRLDSVRR